MSDYKAMLDQPLAHVGMYTPTTMTTSSGLGFDLANPNAGSVTLSDISAGLSRIQRFGGQQRPDQTWSVADHSVFVGTLLAQEHTDHLTIFYGLLHDAHEAYIGDIVSPVKRALQILGAGDAVARLAVNVQRAIHLYFGLQEDPPARIQQAIERADMAALQMEYDRFVRPIPNTTTPPYTGPQHPFLWHGPYDTSSSAARFEHYVNKFRTATQNLPLDKRR